jgi:hypothetical protein
MKSPPCPSRPLQRATDPPKMPHARPCSHTTTRRLHVTGSLCPQACCQGSLGHPGKATSLLNPLHKDGKRSPGGNFGQSCSLSTEQACNGHMQAHKTACEARAKHRQRGESQKEVEGIVTERPKAGAGKGQTHLSVAASTVLGLAQHSSTGKRPRKGSSSATRNREGVVMWGM